MTGLFANSDTTLPSSARLLIDESKDWSQRGNAMRHSWKRSRPTVADDSDEDEPILSQLPPTLAAALPMAATNEVSKSQPAHAGRSLRL